MITLPAFIELVMSTLFGMVDMVMVGRLGPAAITAVGLTNQPFMLLLSVFAAVNIGTTTLVAWRIGAGKPEEAQAVTRQTILISLVLGALVSGVGVLLAPGVVPLWARDPTRCRRYRLFSGCGGRLGVSGTEHGDHSGAPRCGRNENSDAL